MILATIGATRTDAPAVFAIALAVFAVSHGIFDSAAVAFVGEAEANASVKNGRGFRVMFFCVNIGAFCAPLIVFLAGPERAGSQLVAVSAACLIGTIFVRDVKVQPSVPIADSPHALPFRSAAFGLIAVNLILAIFFSAFGQILSSFLKVTATVLTEGSIAVPMSILACLNPLFFMAFTPIVSAFVAKFKPSIQTRLWIAVPFFGAAFVALGSAVTSSHATYFIVLFMTFLTSAEVLLLPTLYAFSSELVGDRNRSSKLGMMSIGIGLGYFLSGWLSKFVTADSGAAEARYFFALSFVVTVLLASVLLIFKSAFAQDVRSLPLGPKTQSQRI